MCALIELRHHGRMIYAFFSRTAFVYHWWTTHKICLCSWWKTKLNFSFDVVWFHSWMCLVIFFFFFVCWFGLFFQSTARIRGVFLSEATQRFTQIFEDMDRLPQLYKYYHKCYKVNTIHYTLYKCYVWGKFNLPISFSWRISCLQAPTLHTLLPISFSWRINCLQAHKQ